MRPLCYIPVNLQRTRSIVVIVALGWSLCGSAFAQPVPNSPFPTYQPPLLPQPPPPPPSGFIQPEPVPLPVTLPHEETASQLRILSSQYPLCVVISENFANRFVQTETYDAGPVQDFVLGARVTGTQQTTATTRLDIIPHAAAARMQVVLNGSTHNQTINTTPQAVLRAQGSYLFELRKQIEFDGSQLKTWSPSAIMTINQRNQNALTPVTGVPVIGQLANLIAITEADRRRPLAEQIAAQKVTQQVGPRFNSEIDTQLAKLNETLQTQLQTKLRLIQLMPERIRTTSTNEAMLLGVAQTRDVPIGLTPPVALEPACGVQVYLHQSHLNELLQQLPLAGLEVPDTALEQLTHIAPGKPLNLQQTAPKLATLIFDQQQPLRTSIQNGVLEMELRIAFRPLLGPIIPTQRLRFQTTAALADEQLTVSTQLVSVDPLDPNTEAVLADIAEKAVRQQLANQLQPRTMPTRIPLPPMPEQRQAPTALRIGVVTMQRGWLSIGLKPETAAQP